MRFLRFSAWLACIAVRLDSAVAAPVRSGLPQASWHHVLDKAPPRHLGNTEQLVEVAGGGAASSAWAAEEALPKLSDKFLSSPSLLAYVVEHETGEIFREREKRSARAPQPSFSFASYWKGNWGGLISFGILFFLGLLVHWFNELRSVKMNTLLSRGLSECESIDAFKVDIDTVGCLVHVQGETVAAAPVTDMQFQGASIINALQLQSTVEVYEWVQTLKTTPSRLSSQGSQDRKGQLQYAFHKEWTTVHKNSLQFQSSVAKPSPDNPRPPRGLSLGTFTSVCKNVQLGGFKLPEDMVKQFTKFEPAQNCLPPTVSACGLQFYTNKDGYYYARPSTRSMWSNKDNKVEPMVGDVRVRFMCVPQGTATVVAVHCLKAGVSTFVPYRAIPRGCCFSSSQDRERLVEEGQRTKLEIRAYDEDMAPCCTSNRMVASCFCCPCTTINSVCSKEVVTEEIYYVSQGSDPIEKPFEWVVPRNRCRVCIFRAIGWLICYLTTLAMAGTVTTQDALQGLRFYGSWARAVFAAAVATAASAFIISIAYLHYSPIHSLKWACATGVVIALPYAVPQIYEHA